MPASPLPWFTGLEAGPSSRRRARRGPVRRAAALGATRTGAVIGLLLLASCGGYRELAAPEGMPLERVRDAVTRALNADGYRDIRHEGPDSARSRLERTTASRPGSATYPGGITAQVSYTGAGEQVRLQVDWSTASMVSLSSHYDELMRKIRAQLRIAQEDALRAAADDGDRPAAAEPPLAPFTGRRWAVIVGISEYEDSNLAVLRKAVKDAEAINDLLRNDPQWGPNSGSTIFFLPDQEATRTNILDRLNEIMELSEEGDMVLIYFACHGKAETRSDRYLVPYDTEVDKLAASAIAQEELLARLDNMPAQRQMLFLDCCFAGLDPSRPGAATRSSDFPPDVFDDLARGRGRAILTSTKGNEFALDSMPGSEHSPFAHFLLEALRDPTGADRDGDGKLTAAELRQKVLSGVFDVAGSAGRRMTPQLYGDESLGLWQREP